MNYDPDYDDRGDDPSYFDEDERDEDGNWPDEPLSVPSGDEERQRAAQLEEMHLEAALFPWLDDDSFDDR